uniref:ORF156 n=1 Tax=Nitzschia sp. (in: diatoms) TaxID=1884248 RepID=A0A2U9GJ79_9STRA|nr:ORF156 [Nitzschia sp. (in: diatoms)]AWQ64295.1 ORF156 [Nitzschia sp. (in: diatoms)]
MDFNFKTYQIVKLKKYFKTNNLFFLFHSAKLNLTKWSLIEQNLKKLKLNYYKPLNKTTVKTFKSSIYKNFDSNIVGFILFISPNYKTMELNLQSLIKSLKSFSFVSIKLNNKIYSVSQLKGLNDLSYKKSAFNFYKVLDKQLKTSYVLTNKKKISK